MGGYDISQWRLAGTWIHTPSDPKMATGSEPASPPFSERCYRSEVIEERTGGPQWAPTPPSMSQGHMEALHTS